MPSSPEIALWRVCSPRIAKAITLAIAAASLFCGAQPASAQFIQQGPKLVGAGFFLDSWQGQGVAISGDGNTALIGGWGDNSGRGATWVFTRNSGAWTQQGPKLVGTDSDLASQGYSVALSFDGNTALVGGTDYVGGAWVFTRNNGVWTQQGQKLIGTGHTDVSYQGRSVALSADGNTALIGAPFDNNDTGAAWVFTRSNGVWTQQGQKLLGTGGEIQPEQGSSVALSADGNTALIGGFRDNNYTGAAWIFTRSNGLWTQQGPKLLGTGGQLGFSAALSGDGDTALLGEPGVGAQLYTRANGKWTRGQELVGTVGVGGTTQGFSVALSADGNTAVVGGPGDDPPGATWVFTRTNGMWTQYGQRLVGSGANPYANQGTSVAVSGTGNTIIVGAPGDSGFIGAAWVFAQPTLQVTPAANIAASGYQGGPFTPTSFQYQLSASAGSLNYAITGIPPWLNANITSGTATTTPITVTFSLNNLSKLTPSNYSGTIAFTNTSTGIGNTSRTATLSILMNRLPRLNTAPVSGLSPPAVR